jgi:hypothetical protein
MTSTDVASRPAASTSTTAVNNNLATTGQFYTDIEDIQASKSRKLEDDIKRVAENNDVHSTAYGAEFPNKLEKNRLKYIL